MGTIPAHHTPPSPPPDAPVCVVVVTGSAPLHRRAIAAVPPGAYVVAADGGLDHARAAGLDPDLLVGDLDSISPVGLAWAVEHAQVERHPADKTCTDTELALALAARRSPDHVLLVAGAGDRLDHALAALGALGAPSLERVAEVEGWWGCDHVRVARPGRPVTLERRARHHVLGARRPRRVRRRHGHRCPLAAHRRDARPARRTRRVERGDRAAGRRRRRRRHRHRARSRSPAVRRGSGDGDARRSAAGPRGHRAGVGTIRRRRCDARGVRLVPHRGHEPERRPRALHRRDRHRRAHRGRRRHRHDGVEGGVDRRQPRGRRDVGGRQHVPLAGGRRRRVRALRGGRSRRRAGGAA